MSACKKEKTFLYEVEDVTISPSGTGKDNVKSTTEFISIAYADLYGTGISSTYLQQLNVIYNSFGDKKLIEERIIRAFLNDPAAIIPASVSVNGDTAQFIINTYKKFYNRMPDAFESYYVKELIRTDIYTTPRVIYYSFMTSDEYRYY
jgi:hypothetical protein